MPAKLDQRTALSQFSGANHGGRRTVTCTGSRHAKATGPASREWQDRGLSVSSEVLEDSRVTSKHPAAAGGDFSDQPRISAGP
jgi:hypothetical protein